MTPLTRTNRPLSDDVYDALLGELVSLRVPPNGHLSVDGLARQLNVSQTPVRAALIKLQSEGLVTRRHNMGFRAASLPTAQHFHEVYLVRSLLEPEVAALAADNATAHDIRKLEELCAQMATLVNGDTEKNYGKFAELDGKFHRKILDISANELIGNILDNLHAHMHLFRLRYHASVAEQAIDEHQHILQAIVVRDACAARQAMTAHVKASCKRMRPYYAQLLETRAS